LQRLLLPVKNNLAALSAGLELNYKTFFEEKREERQEVR
jgi:hypothetical protein